MKIKAKPSFMELDISNNYQGLDTPDYEALKRGKTIELKKIPVYIEGHIEKVKEKNNGS